MKSRHIVDLTSSGNASTIIDCIDESSEEDDFQVLDIVETAERKAREKEDYELAKSLQIAEYTNWSREAFQVKQTSPLWSQTTGERDTKQITRYFQQPDIVVEAVNIKSKKRKLTAKEEEEKARAYELNKRFIGNVLSRELELIDPTPNIDALFDLFNKTFFYDSLVNIPVKWSKRMTLCAGICRMKGISISISLSEPLLSLRQRSDTVNTLLHEMIHAYLFVTRNYFDRDDHGDEFKKHMRRINEKAHSQITIYHTFHDEVESCRKWWWQCDGPCRKRPPYYGIVKRAMNRPPQKADWWFEKHQKECGGTYHLIKSPTTATKSTPPSKQDFFKKKDSKK